MNSHDAPRERLRLRQSLEDVRCWLLEHIDGGEEVKGYDSILSEYINTIDDALRALPPSEKETTGGLSREHVEEIRYKRPNDCVATKELDGLCDMALELLRLRSLSPSATGAMPKAFYEIVEVANTEGMPDSTPLPIWPKDVAWDFTPLTVGDIRAVLAAAPAPALAEPVAWTTVLKMIERGMAVYKERHPKWWKRMDGTPILNDLPVVIATEICETTLYTAPQAAPVEAGAITDVERYQWLRKPRNFVKVNVYHEQGSFWEAAVYESLDRYIDAAIEKDRSYMKRGQP